MLSNEYASSDFLFHYYSAFASKCSLLSSKIITLHFLEKFLHLPFLTSKSFVNWIVKSSKQIKRKRERKKEREREYLKSIVPSVPLILFSTF